MSGQESSGEPDGVVAPSTGSTDGALNDRIYVLTPDAAIVDLPAGSTARVFQLTGDASFCQRVREMGFGEAALVTKISGTSTSLCLVNGMRVALNHRAATVTLAVASTFALAVPKVESSTMAAIKAAPAAPHATPAASAVRSNAPRLPGFSTDSTTRISGLLPSLKVSSE